MKALEAALSVLMRPIALRWKAGLCVFWWLALPMYAPAQPCVSDFFLQQYLILHPEKRQQLESLEHFTQQWITENEDKIASRAVITIPVVVHIVWKNQDENITDAQVFSQLEVLNRDFQALNKEISTIPAIFKPALTNVAFEFCLARRTPDGKPTTGITRTRTGVERIGTAFIQGKRAICHTELGGQNAWDTRQYLNIWIGKFEFGLGEANFPDAAQPEEDGVRVDPTVFGMIGTAADAPYNLGRTTTHEIGHYFNLRHPWGERLGDCNTDDGVTDTPRQSIDFRGECPTHPQLFCGTASMFMNFMNYSDDACLAMFTNGQKTRMLATLNGFRAGLLFSLGCDTPTTAAGEPSFVSGIRVLGNPVRHWLHLQSNTTNFEIFSLQLINIQGRIVWREDWNTAFDYRKNVHFLAAGIYFLILRHENNYLYEKIVITP